MTDDQKATIMARVREKGVRVCPACQRPTIEVVGATPISLNENFKQIRLAGEVLPSVLIGCSNCGHVWHHALVFLGFPDGF